MSTEPERFKIVFLGADEDVPRLGVAYGRGCGGEVVFVVRPRDGKSLLVHQVKKEPAKTWRTDLGLGPSHAPELPMSPGDALREIKAMKASPPPAGPATLRGTWSGHLFCTDGTPSVRLERKVVSYGTLKVASGPDGRWTATFDRAGKWFSQPKQESVERSSLADAIQAGMGLVIGLVAEACTFRDTRRRNAVDADFAVDHPYRAPPEHRDVTDRYRGRSTFRAVEGADGWTVVNDVGGVVAKFGKREKGKAEKHASALTRGKEPPAATVSPEIAAGFGLTGMPGVRVQAPSLDSIPAPESPSCATSVANIASATEKEAEALGELAQSLWGSTEAPELLARAGKLIKHAQALVASPLCTGTERQAALEDVRRAAGAYQQAWDALARGEKPDIVTTLRRIAERVSLAATRAAKSCAAGQQKLGRPARSVDDVAAGIGQRETGWRYGDRVTWEGQTWIVQDVRGDGYVDVTREGSDLADTAPATELRAAPAGASWAVGETVYHQGKAWTITRADREKASILPVGGTVAKAGVPLSQLSRTPPATVSMQPVWPPAAPSQPVATTKRTRKAKAAEVDPEKDKLLVNAFADAIKQAAASMGGA